MSSRERLPSVQVSGHMPGQPLRVGPETNIRLIDRSAIAGVTCRRVEVRCAVRPAELCARCAASLRHRHGVVAVPSPFASSEILVLGVKRLPVDQFRDKSWRAEIHDLGKNVEVTSGVGR